MKNPTSVFKHINTSSVRNNLSDVVDTVLSKERVIFTRYGKEKAALMTTDDAKIIEYLLDKKDYERILKLAREVKKETDEVVDVKNSA